METSLPVLSLVLRGLLGVYVIFMARRFYADPTGHFRRSMRGLAEFPWLAPLVRASSLFCLWGGCFIVATAIAVEIFGLHGDILGLTLIAIAAAATWFLLPKDRAATGTDSHRPGQHRMH